MNVWILRQDLDPIAAASADLALAAIARRVRDAYIYPVDSLVLSSTGELLDHVGANDVMLDDARYMRLLDAARR